MLTPLGAAAQEVAVPPPQSDQVVRVFYDCNGYACDFDHVRREIAFVDWVRDRQDADVHVLITSEHTGGGGTLYTVALIGLREFAGTVDTLQHATAATDTQAEDRAGLTQTIRLGLVRFVAATPIGRELQIIYEAPEGAGFTAGALPAADPWNFWVFRLGVDGSVEGEEQQSAYSVEGSASADRTTEAFKFNLELSGEYVHEKYTLSDSTELVSATERYTAGALAVWSLTRHWSAGAVSDAERSTYNNLDLRVSGGPAVEYNIFPYEESTRKAFTFLYALEMAYFNYREITVEDALSEVRPRHRLEIGVGVTQPWGNIWGQVTGIQYLDDPKVHRITLDAGIDLRVFRGFNLEVNTEIARVKDQFFLPAEGLSDEDILLERQARETNFAFDLSIGFSYRFGSKFNNVVNPRMGGGGGGHH
jgi:hypothetical protein